MRRLGGVRLKHIGVTMYPDSYKEYCNRYEKSNINEFRSVTCCKNKKAPGKINWHDYTLEQDEIDSR